MMKTKWIIQAVVFVIGAGCGEQTSRIHRGERSSHPFVGQVVEYKGDRYGGSGSVIFPRCVLTAAHVADAGLDWFCLGSEPAAESNPLCARVIRSVTLSGPGYRCDNDLALLKLAPFDDGKNSNISDDQYQAVPIGYTRPMVPAGVRVIGYGASEIGSKSGYSGLGIQREGHMSITGWFSPSGDTAPRCIRAEPYKDSPEQNMALPGDSGGPVLASSGELIGVTHSYNEGLRFNEFVSVASTRKWLREKQASFCDPNMDSEEDPLYATADISALLTQRP